MTKITLDAEAFKVLASDTRLSILKALDDRPKTVSELGRELDLNKATVHEHLQQLLNGDLIKKNDSEGRKWVYYTLSWKGRSLLHPENTTVLVLLGLAVAGSGAAAVQLGNWLRWWGQGAVMDALTEGESGDTNEQDAGIASAPEDGDSSQQGDPGDPSGSPPPEDDGAPESSQLRQDADLGENQTAQDADAGPWWDFVEDAGFWIFAILALMATALFVAAAVVKARARAPSS